MKAIKIYLALITSLLLVIIYKVWFHSPQEDIKIIRANGIVIEDLNGKDRILIGAPVPPSSDRVRTDTQKVKQLWGKYFPPEYMSYYKNYSHDNFGLLILDENGIDRVAIGDPAPDPNIGKRIGPSTGVIINDEEGFERTGYGLINIDGQTRVVLGLDNENGTEGLSLAIFENGTTGLSINSKTKNIFLGKTDTSSWQTDHVFPYNGLLINEEEGKKIELNSSK